MADQKDVESGKDSKETNSPISPMEYQLKKYLLPLATLVATVTYAAGLNPPGGSWLEDDTTNTNTSSRHMAGDSIFRETNYVLLLHRGDQGWLLKLTRAVMVVDLLGLMGAYAAGGSHDRFTTVCTAGLVGATFACIAFFVPCMIFKQDTTTTTTTTPPPPPPTNENADDEQSKHEILLVLAIFVATIAYVTGVLSPLVASGGAWDIYFH